MNGADLDSDRQITLDESRAGRRPTIRPAAAALVLLGLFFGIIGPYGTVNEPVPARLGFWLSMILAGGVIGALTDSLLRRFSLGPWRRLVATSAVMTPFVTLLVVAAMILLLGHKHGLFSIASLSLVPQVFMISLAVMALLQLLRRPVKQIIRTRTVIAPPLPEAEAAFRTRLSAKLRSAKLIAIEAHDHYVRVHTDAGTELINLKLSDAVAELARVQGFRVHRSWWVASDAIRQARWHRASGRLTLDGGLVAPISRSGAPALREAGWL